MRAEAPRQALWIAWRLHRFEFTAAALASILLGTAILFVAWQIWSLAASPECQQLFIQGATSEDVSRCSQLIEYTQAQQSYVNTAFAALSLTPLVGGVLLGAPLISREIEQRTAEFAWSLSPSRSRWLWMRAIPPAALLTVLLLMLGQAGELLERVRLPILDPAASFLDYGSRGPLLAVRGLAIFAVALGVGAALGRVLPALIISAALSSVVLVGIPSLALNLEPRIVVSPQDAQRTLGFLAAVPAWRTREGTILSDAEARSMSPAPGDPRETILWLAREFEAVMLIVPGEKMPEVALKEAIGQAALGALSVGAVVLLVRTRRPY
jgi:hypothetical protein